MFQICNPNAVATGQYGNSVDESFLQTIFFKLRFIQQQKVSVFVDKSLNH